MKKIIITLTLFSIFMSGCTQLASDSSMSAHSVRKSALNSSFSINSSKRSAFRAQ